MSAVVCVAAMALSATAAAAAPTRVAVAEAENGTLDGWYMRTVADTSASNGAAVRFDWPGSVRLKLKLPADADTIGLRVRGDQCGGAPAYSLTIDNAPVADDTAASTAWTDRLYSEPLVAGTHSVEVRYTNDYSQPWPNACDRNLYLDAVTFSASAPLRRNPPVPGGFVHQSGTGLLDGADRPLRLRGVNLGGWLLWEGWIWGQGFDYIGESAMINNLAKLVGAAEAERFRGEVRDSYVTGADFDAMSAYGFNVARVPFNYRLLEDDAQPFVYKQSGWSVLDRVISDAKQANVYLVLDMHAAPCSQMHAFVSDYVGPEDLWSSPNCRDRMVALWKAIAARYADQNIIAGYDVLNESTTDNAQLLALYKRATEAIRQVDRNHLLIYEGNNMARTFDLFTAPLDSNEMLSFHDYPWAFIGQALTARMPGYDAAAKRINAPQWAGEFGQSSYEDVQKYVTTFNNDPLIAGWAQWTWKQSPGLPALQTIQHTPASQKLIYWINNPNRPRPNAAEATQGMSDFITAIRFENTTHDAKLKRILRSPESTAPASEASPSATPEPGASESTAPEPADSPSTAPSSAPVSSAPPPPSASVRRRAAGCRGKRRRGDRLRSKAAPRSTRAAAAGARAPKVRRLHSRKRRHQAACGRRTRRVR